MFFCSERISDSHGENKPCGTKRESGVRNREYGAVLFSQEVSFAPHERAERIYRVQNYSTGTVRNMKQMPNPCRRSWNARTAYSI